MAGDIVERKRGVPLVEHEGTGGKYPAEKLLFSGRAAGVDGIDLLADLALAGEQVFRKAENRLWGQ